MKVAMSPTNKVANSKQTLKRMQEIVDEGRRDNT